MNIKSIGLSPSFFQYPLRQKITELPTFFRFFTQAPLRDKIGYSIGGIVICATIFLVVSRILNSSKAKTEQRTLVTADEMEELIEKIKEPLQKLPACDKAKTIYVYFYSKSVSMIWFEQLHGKFYKYRDQYEREYRSTLLLAVPLNEEASKELKATDFFLRQYAVQPWLKTFTEKDANSFPGNYLALTYDEYQHAKREQVFPPGILAMFRNNAFSAAFPSERKNP